MNLSNIIAVVCCILLIPIGLDKFLNFLEPPCSIMGSIPTTIWKGLGVIQIAGGILILIPKLRRPVASFFFCFMLFFTVFHIINSTYDIGGSAFMAGLLAVLVWNPGFLGAK